MFKVLIICLFLVSCSSIKIGEPYTGCTYLGYHAYAKTYDQACKDAKRKRNMYYAKDRKRR